jgi:hypothetical protein
MAYSRETNPTQLPVQMNITIPWQMREDLTMIARDRHVSLAEMTREALYSDCRDELAMIARKRTVAAGATS